MGLELLRGTEGLLDGVPLECAATFPVVERFVSLNGEGLRAGQMAAFIRFAGCNLDCSYCDTAWANGPDCEVERLGADELAAFVGEHGAACVTLTGGEPLLQPELPALVVALLQEPAVHRVEIETNGSLSLGEMARLRERLMAREVRRALDAYGNVSLAFTVDCKLPSSGCFDAMDFGNYQLLDAGDSVKFVCGTEEDLRCALEVMDRFGMRGAEGPQVLLSPVFGRMEPARIAEFIIENRLAWARLQLQMHKIVWPGVDKGV